MPHLTLEYTSNVLEKSQLSELLSNFNTYLSATLATDLAGCRSRCMEYTTYSVGDGNNKNAFVHIHLQIMPGRDSDKLNQIGSNMMDMLKMAFQKSTIELNLQFSIEIDELQKTYFKAK